MSNAMFTSQLGSSRVGDLHEIIAAAWLMGQGYEVCRNMGCTGPVDLVAVHPETDEVLLIDVKSSFTVRSSDGYFPSNKDTVRRTIARQERLGVKYLTVINGRCYWSKEDFLNDQEA